MELKLFIIAWKDERTRNDIIVSIIGIRHDAKGTVDEFAHLESIF